MPADVKHTTVVWFAVTLQLDAAYRNGDPGIVDVYHAVTLFHDADGPKFHPLNTMLDPPDVGSDFKSVDNELVVPVVTFNTSTSVIVGGRYDVVMPAPDAALVRLPTVTTHCNADPTPSTDRHRAST